MANSKSAMKRIRQNEKRRGRNRSIRSRVRTVTKAFDEAVEEGNVEQAQEEYARAVSALDRAASKGIIPSKRASRKKSRLAQRLQKITD